LTRSFIRFTALFTILFSFIFLFSPKAAYTAKAAGTDTINLDAEGAILIDQQSGKILYQKNADERLYPASTTKTMTALVALEKGNLNDTITVGKEVLLIPWDSSKAFLKEGEQITLKELLMGLMLPSGNDAAMTIAVYIGRKVSGDMSLVEDKAIDKFIELMNERAKQLGANDSHFVNPHGYDNKDHYTTPHDLALIAREAMKNEYFRQVVSTYKYNADKKPVILNGQIQESVDHTWVNSNELINKSGKDYYEFATGIKTGYTTPAGQCVVSSASKNGMDIIAVIMRSSTPGRWTDSKKLLEYGFQNFALYNGADKDEAVSTLKVDNPLSKKHDSLTVVPDQDFIDTFKKEETANIQTSIVWDKNLISLLKGEDGKIKLLSSVKTGQVIGKEVFTLGGSVLKEINLKAREGVKKQSIMSIGNVISFFVGMLCGAVGILILLKRAAKRRRRINSNSYRGFSH
jgi:D-alanyl-D-alanine carboxypeptidase